VKNGKRPESKRRPKLDGDSIRSRIVLQVADKLAERASRMLTEVEMTGGGAPLDQDEWNACRWRLGAALADYYEARTARALAQEGDT
jgi:hypothetical protein